MCGIVGYVGHQQAIDYLIEGLHRLEYRGYDSSGVVTITSKGKFSVVKTAGRIDLLEQKLADFPAEGTIGIGHTRWATHGARRTTTRIRTLAASKCWRWCTTA